MKLALQSQLARGPFSNRYQPPRRGNATAARSNGEEVRWGPGFDNGKEFRKISTEVQQLHQHFLNNLFK